MNNYRSQFTLIIITALAALSFCMVAPASVSAAFNREINYQGKLMASDGSLVSDGAYNIRFNLYDASGNSLWTETLCESFDNGVTCDGTGTDGRVSIKNGLFSVLLGSTTPFGSLNFDQPLYLGVQVGGSDDVPTWDSEMTPRKLLGAVPASFIADFANTAALASLATHADSASTSDFATNAGFATTSSFSTNSGFATTSSFSDTSGFATTSAFANNAGFATTSMFADTAGFATSSLSAQAASSSDNSLALEGIRSAQFVRNDIQNATSSNVTFFNVIQNGIGKVAEFFGQAGNSVLAILSNGNVGIGTTSPTTKFEVAGNGYFSGDLTAANITATGTLTLASSLNGFLQATNGFVSATSSPAILGSYVPYTGATTGLNLGSQTFTTTGQASLTNASTTNFTISNAGYLTGLASSLLAVNQNGQIVATTTSSFSYTETDPIYTAASSSLLRFGTTSDALTEGSVNRFWSDSLFDARLFATTSLPNISTLSGLSSIGSSTGVTTILGHTILDSASTSALTVSGSASVSSLSIGSLNGFLKALSGSVIATSSISLESDVSGVLPYYLGGTGTSTILANNLLIGNQTGTGWVQVSTSSLGILPTSPGAGYTLFSRSSGEYEPLLIGGTITSQLPMQIVQTSPEGIFKSPHGVAQAEGKIFIGTVSANSPVYVFSDPNDLDTYTSVNMGSANGSYSSIVSVIYDQTTGYIYALLGQSGVLSIIKIDPDTYATSTLIHTASINAGTGGAITSDGTYLYGVTSNSPTIIYKVNLSTGSLEQTATWTGAVSGHGILSYKYSDGHTELYATDSSGLNNNGTGNHFAKINGADLSINSITLVPASGKWDSTDDAAFQYIDESGGYVFLGNEDSYNGSANGIRVKTSDLSYVQFNAGKSYGMFNLGGNIYNANYRDDQIEEFTGGDITSFTAYPTYPYMKTNGNDYYNPNEVLSINGNIYFTVFSYATDSILVEGNISGSGGTYITFADAVNFTAGLNSTTTGTQNVNLGNGNTISGVGNVILGNDLNVTGTGQIVVGLPGYGLNIGSSGVNISGSTNFNSTTTLVNSDPNDLSYLSINGGNITIASQLGDPMLSFGYDANGSPTLHIQDDAQNPIFDIMNGNIGIGTTSPTTKFGVAGNGYFSGDLTATNMTATGTLNVSGNATLGNASTSALTVNGLASVGSLSIGSLSGFLKVSSGSVSATSSIALGSDVSGVLSYSNGGTGTSTVLANSLLIGNSSGTGWTQVSTSSLGIVASPAGSSGQVQFNNGGVMSGSSDFTFSTTTGQLFAPKLRDGEVAILHGDGSWSYIVATTTTDVGRGNTLLYAITTATSGDSIYLSASTFNIGTNSIDLTSGSQSLSIHGAGKYLTTIKSAPPLGGSGTGLAIKAASNSETSDLTIQLTDNSYDAAGWGTVSSTDVSSTTIRNVRIIGYNEGIYIANTGTTTARVINTDIVSNYEGVYWHPGGGSLAIYDGNIAITADAGVYNGGLITRGIVVNNGKGLVSLYNTNISATGGSTSNYGVYTTATNSSSMLSYAYVYGGAITTAGTGAYDLYNENKQYLAVTANTTYSVSKISTGTNGLVTTLDSDQIVRSLAYSTQNVGIGTTTPGSLLTVAGNGYFSGNLGVGTATPTKKLVVAGDALVTSASTWASGQTATLYFGDSGHYLSVPFSSGATWSNYNGIKFSNHTGTPLSVGATAGVGGSSNVGIGGNITNVDTLSGATMAVLGTGNVGIGNVSPQYKLDVNGTIGNSSVGWSMTTGIYQNSLILNIPKAGDNIARMYFQGNSASGAQTVFYNPTGSAALQVQNEVGANNYIRSYNSPLIVGVASGTQSLTIGTGYVDNMGSQSTGGNINLLPGMGGNVGIGSSTPSAYLTVHATGGSSSATPLFVIATSTSSGTATSTILTVASNGTTTLAGNFNPAADNAYSLGVSGSRWSTIYSVTTNVGDLVFGNDFRINEATTSDGSTDKSDNAAVYWNNQKNEQIFKLDAVGNLSVTGDVCTGANCVNKSIEAINVKLDSLSSSTLAILNEKASEVSPSVIDSVSITSTDVSVQLASLTEKATAMDLRIGVLSRSIDDVSLRIDELSSSTDKAISIAVSEAISSSDLASSTAEQLVISDSFISKIASSSISMIVDSASFLKTVTSAVIDSIGKVGELALNKLSAHIAYLTRVEAETVAVSKGLELTDGVTGEVYCVSIRGGDWSRQLGTCSIASTSPVLTSFTDSAISSNSDKTIIVSSLPSTNSSVSTSTGTQTMVPVDENASSSTDSSVATTSSTHAYLGPVGSAPESSPETAPTVSSTVSNGLSTDANPSADISSGQSNDSSSAPVTFPSAPVIESSTPSTDVVPDTTVPVDVNAPTDTANSQDSGVANN